MEKDNKNTVLIVAAVLIIICIALVCLGAVALFLFGFGVSSTALFDTPPPIETTSLSSDQLEQCRQAFAINDDIELEADYYLYTPGFQDDSMECHLQAQADSLEEIFDLTVIDPHETGTQEVAPGRHVSLTIEEIEPGIYRIEGFWFQT